MAKYYVYYDYYILENHPMYVFFIYNYTLYSIVIYNLFCINNFRIIKLLYEVKYCILHTILYKRLYCYDTICKLTLFIG